MDVTRVSKTINAPLRYVYEWCTDFREDDPQITGSKSQRKILEKTKKRVVYAQIYTGLDGAQKVTVDIVTLSPPSSWHLDYFGEEDDETGEYRLRALGKDRTRLDMVFREKWKKIRKGPHAGGTGKPNQRSLGQIREHAREGLQLQEEMTLGHLALSNHQDGSLKTRVPDLKRFLYLRHLPPRQTPSRSFDHPRGFLGVPNSDDCAGEFPVG